MKNHSWVPDQEFIFLTKSQVCTKCGLRRSWAGAGYQAWEYTVLPNCKVVAKGLKHGLLHNGTFSLWKRPDCL